MGKGAGVYTGRNRPSPTAGMGLGPGRCVDELVGFQVGWYAGE